MFDKNTYEIIIKNYYYKRKLHEKAIKRMLAKMSDSELEGADIDINQYMKDSIHFIESKNRKELEGRIIHEKDIAPISTIIPHSIKDALTEAIGSHTKNKYIPTVYSQSSRKNSYQILQNSGMDLKMIFDKRMEGIKMPSFMNSTNNKKRPSGNKDISDFFKRVNSISILDKKGSI